jgi:hypothetical protein
MSLVELIVVGVLGLVVLTMAGTMLSIMTRASTATSSKIEAELKTRQSLDDAMRYLRNSASVAKCDRWKVDSATSTDYSRPASMANCIRFGGTVSPVLYATASEFDVLAYVDGSTPDNASSAPDILTFKIDAGTLKVGKLNGGDVSVLAAYCVLKNSTTGDCAKAGPGGNRSPGASDIWPSTTTTGLRSGLAGLATTLWTIDVSSASAFTFLDGTGNAPVTPQSADVKAVVVDIGAKFKDANNTEQTFVYRATASIRGASFGSER